tara:strand:+ start:248 stop:718 length:471 start_codon:yes stop_codon:yes gene_type:complete
MEPLSIAALVAAFKKALEILGDSKKAMSLLRGFFTSNKKKATPKNKISKQQAEFKRIAEKAIRAKNLEIQRQNELYRMDEIHGLGTSARIIEAEEEEKKAKIKRRKREKRKKKKQAEFRARLFYWIKQFLQFVAVIGFAAFVTYWIWINRCTSGNC